jgi:hypothetical protein
LFLCHILRLLLHCDAIAFLASAYVGFLLLSCFIEHDKKMFVHLKKFLIKLQDVSKKNIQSLPNILGCQIGHPTSTDQPCASKLLHLYLCVWDALPCNMK